MLLSGPGTVGVTTNVTVAVPPNGKSPNWQVMVLVPLQLPRLGVTETKFTPADKVSDIVTFGAPPCPPTGVAITVMV